jgi:hypothetical protein
MGRLPKTNQVPRAPFSLIDTGALPSAEVYNRVGFKWFVAANGAAVEPRATLDAKVCPYCDATVEWALTVKRDASAPKGRVNYVYARCTAHPGEHRWGLSDTPESRALPIPKPQPTPPPTPTPTPEETPMTAPAGSFDALLSSAITATVGERLKDVEGKIKDLIKQQGGADPEALKALIASTLDTARTVEIKVPAMPEIHFKGKAHPALPRVLKLIATMRSQGRPCFFLLVGPAASGKSTLAAQIAEALGKQLTAVSINETMTREELLGWRTPNIQTGETRYSPCSAVIGWERGDVILLDELDRGNPNTLCAWNSIEQRVLYVPRDASEGGPLAKMGEGAVVIGTANTYGTGASRTYVGANQLDAAFLDRWFVIEVGYDHDLETAISGSPEGVKLIEAARARATERSVRRPLTTRMLCRAALVSAVDSKPMPEAFKALCTESGWTQTEITSVWS